MTTLDHFHRLFRYDEWANREVLASFKAAGSPPSRALKLMAHVLGAEYLWLSRIEGGKSPLAVWPDLKLADCEEYASRLARVWSDYLDNLTAEQLTGPITYTNSKGERWTNSVEDILLHVTIHSAYHRGQIATDMRAAGYSPAYTDFIHSVRQKLVS